MAKESPFKNNVLAGKVALITGGGSGICFEIGRQFGLHGASIMIMGRRDNVIKASVEKLQAQGIQADGASGDVRKEADCLRVVAQTLERFGQLDVLVNGAAGNFLVPAESLSANGFKTVLEIDSVGTFTMCRSAFPALRRGSSGHATSGGLIINISATLHYSANWYQIHVAAAKAAIDSLTRSLALEWGKDYGVRVNGIAPGPIGDTPGLFKLDPSRAKNMEVEFKMSDVVPVGRVGESWDIAMSALYLASSAGDWISGETVVVDGANWLFKPQYVSRRAIEELSRSTEEQMRGRKLSTKGKNDNLSIRSKL